MSPPVVASHPSNLHRPPLIVFDHCWPPPSPPLITFYITCHHRSSHQYDHLQQPLSTILTTINHHSDHHDHHFDHCQPYFDHQSDHHRLLLWPTPLLNNMIGHWINHSLNWVPNFPIFIYLFVNLNYFYVLIVFFFFILNDCIVRHGIDKLKLNLKMKLSFLI
jgi:hypothetical protein